MNINKKIIVAHLFSAYPGSNTTNWLYNLIINTPNCHVIIAAEDYTKHNFFDNSFTYIDNPSASISAYKKTLKTWSSKLPEKLVCYITEKILGNYNNYIAKNEHFNKASIVHVHFADVACKYVDMIKSKSLPMVVSFYGYDYEYLPFIKPQYRNLYKELFKKADIFICEGLHGSKILIDMGCPEHKIKIIKLGVEIEKIEKRQKSKQENSLKLIQASTFSQKKGQIYTIKAFNEALKKNKNMHLTLIGYWDESIYNELKQFIQANNLQERVQMLNEIDFHKLHSFLDDYDVFIHPSCYSDNMDCEGGAPIVLLDAQACGLPVISTTHCDIPDEVIHEKTGLLTPEKDVLALAQSINTFYKMGNDEYQLYSKNARKHVEENYSVKKNALQLKQIYDNLLKEYANTI